MAIRSVFYIESVILLSGRGKTRNQGGGISRKIRRSEKKKKTEQKLECPGGIEPALYGPVENVKRCKPPSDGALRHSGTLTIAYLYSTRAQSLTAKRLPGLRSNLKKTLFWQAPRRLDWKWQLVPQFTTRSVNFSLISTRGNAPHRGEAALVRRTLEFCGENCTDL